MCVAEKLAPTGEVCSASKCGEQSRCKKPGVAGCSETKETCDTEGLVQRMPYDGKAHADSESADKSGNTTVDVAARSKPSVTHVSAGLELSDSAVDCVSALVEPRSCSEPICFGCSEHSERCVPQGLLKTALCDGTPCSGAGDGEQSLCTKPGVVGWSESSEICDTEGLAQVMSADGKA